MTFAQFNTRGNWGTERSNVLCTATQSAKRGVRIWNHGICSIVAAPSIRDGRWFFSRWNKNGTVANNGYVVLILTIYSVWPVIYR